MKNYIGFRTQAFEILSYKLSTKVNNGVNKYDRLFYITTFLDNLIKQNYVLPPSFRDYHEVRDVLSSDIIKQAAYARKSSSITQKVKRLETHFYKTLLKYNIKRM